MTIDFYILFYTTVYKYELLGKSISNILNTTTIIYFNEVVFPSVLGLTLPMAFPQHSPPP